MLMGYNPRTVQKEFYYESTKAPQNKRKNLLPYFCFQLNTMKIFVLLFLLSAKYDDNICIMILALG